VRMGKGAKEKMPDEVQPGRQRVGADESSRRIEQSRQSVAMQLYGSACIPTL
jgi:hypothetical protein